MSRLTEWLYGIQQLGLQIDTVYDIGACVGNWSREIQDKVCPNADFILFEANPAYNEILSNSKFRYFNTVLSNPGREFVEFYNGTNTGDSYYKENTTTYDNQTTVRLLCSTLDAIINEYNLPIPNLIKLDTQGSELDILAGAESIVDKVDLMYVECPIINYNIGAPSIQDYLDYFKNKEFVPVDLLETHQNENILLQVDIMFMKRETKERILTPTRQVRI